MPKKKNNGMEEVTKGRERRMKIMVGILFVGGLVVMVLASLIPSGG